MLLRSAMARQLSRLNVFCLPDAIKDVKYYTFGDNKTEQAARAYWAKIKGEENV